MAAVKRATPAGSNGFNAQLNYYREDADEEYFQHYPGTAGDKTRKHNTKQVLISDMRGGDFGLNTSGFQLVDHVTSEKTFDNDERIKSDAYEEAAELKKKVTGATHVHPFSHLVRRETYQQALEAAQHMKSEEIVQATHPILLIHCDQSYKGAVEVLKDNLPPADVERLSKTRWSIINIWRPIERPVKRDPLAVSDSRSIPESDLRPRDLILPQKGQGVFDKVSQGTSFEMWALAANPEHRWYYVSEMRPDEALMVKCFDSKKDERARRCLHSAFLTANEDDPPRTNFEVRCLVFWEDQKLE